MRTDGAVTFVRVHGIDWVDATGDQVRLHVGKATLLLRDTMREMVAAQ